MASNRSRNIPGSVSGRSLGLSIAARLNRPPVAPPPPLYYVKLILLLPMPGHGYSDLEQVNIDIEEALNQIRRKFEVALTILGDGDMVEIKAFNRRKADEALKALRELLQRKPGDRVVWRPLALIKPPQGDHKNARIALIPQEGLDGARATAIAGPKTTTEPDDAAEPSEYREEFEKALALAMENLRYVPNRMRMRINFGHILLKEWKKEQPEYTLSELKLIAERSGPRGTVFMHTHIGHDNAVSRIREQLPLMFEDCEAHDIRVHNLEDMQPSISLVLLTKNLISESVVDLVRSKTDIGSKEKIKYGYFLAPMTVFHREKRTRAVTIMTSCPEERFDWCLEVESQVKDQMTTLPFNDSALRQNVHFKDSVLTDGFPPININPAFLKANRVDIVVGKTTWNYLINSQYVLEVGLYHQWNQNTTGKPKTGAVVSLYGADWEHELGPADISTGPRDWTTFPGQFLKPNPDSEADDSTRLNELFSLISKIQDLLAKATEGSS